MRIGILTQPLRNNYGGLLQNYALQQVLKKKGYEVETIDHGSKKVSFLHSILSYIKNIIINFFMSPDNYYPTAKEQSVIDRNTLYFANKYITHTKALHSRREFCKISERGLYDAYIVGSDQCWRPKYNIFLEEMFLSFAEKQKNIKRIAYAASFGTDAWEMETEMTNKCGRLVKQFDLVTVRELSAVNLCRKYLGKEAYHVLDPTLLLDKKDYEELVTLENEPANNKTLFHYILDPSADKERLILSISKFLNMTPYTVMPKYQKGKRSKHDVKDHIEDCIYAPVTAWLRAFIDAKMVIVDSFHGAVFSIIFNKPFLVVENGKRGNARFDSLLSLFNLKYRLISPEDDFKKVICNTIDWSMVNSILEKEKKKSLNMLFKELC